MWSWPYSNKSWVVPKYTVVVLHQETGVVPSLFKLYNTKPFQGIVKTTVRNSCASFLFCGFLMGSLVWRCECQSECLLSVNTPLYSGLNVWMNEWKCYSECCSINWDIFDVKYSVLRAREFWRFLTHFQELSYIFCEFKSKRIKWCKRDVFSWWITQS